MLTGTLVTAAGFLPIATAQSSVGEYTRSIFQVVSIALIISWFAAVIVILYLGFKILPDHVAHDPNEKNGRCAIIETLARCTTPFSRRLLQCFRGLIRVCVNYPLLVILLTIAAFVGSLNLFQFVQKQFFPDLMLGIDCRLEIARRFFLASDSARSQTFRNLPTNPTHPH